MTDRSIVITGLGAITPLGLTAEDYWRGLINGESGIGPITLFDASSYPSRLAAEVKGFEPTDYINRKDARRMDRFAQLSVAASLQAVKHSGLRIDSTNQDDIGVIIGSGIGGLTTLFEQIKVLLEQWTKLIETINKEGKIPIKLK